MMNVGSSKRKWDELASKWTLTGPPASPSDEDVGNFRFLLTHGLELSSSTRVMLLGCTLALRTMLSDLCYHHHMEVVCVDISSMMYTRTSEAMAEPNPHETFECLDWLEMNLGKASFTAILGDKVVDNVMPEDWDTFFKRLQRHSEPDGLLILRVAPQNMTLKGATFRGLLTRWADRYRRGMDSLPAVVSGLWEELLGASAFKGSMRHTTQQIGRFADEVNDLMTRYGCIDEVEKRVFADFLELFWASKDESWSSYDYEEILDRLGAFFTHETTVHSTDYGAASHQPIIRARRKG